MQDQDLKNSNQPEEKSAVQAKKSSFFSGIKYQLVKIILLTAFSGILVVFLFSFFIVRHAEKKEAAVFLNTIAQLKKDKLDQFFTRLNLQITGYISQSELQSAFADLKEGFNAAGDEFTDMESVNAEISEFYTDYTKNLNDKSGWSFKTAELVPPDAGSKILQYFFLSRPDGKDKNPSVLTYNAAHETWQKMLGNILKGTGADDILLIDSENGNVIYSFRKNSDFSTGLLTGPYRTTNLAMVFNEVVSTNRMAVSDVDLYSPAFLKPVFFVAVPFNSSEAVLALRFSSETILSFLNNRHEKVQNYLAGSDFYLRSDDNRMKTDKSAFLNRLKKSDLVRDKLVMMDSLNTCINLVSLPSEIFSKAALGYPEIRKFHDYSNEKVMAFLTPVSFGKNRMYLVTQEETASVFHASGMILKWGIPVVLLLFGILLRVASQNGIFFSKRIRTIHESIHALAEGTPVNIQVNGATDEINDTMKSIGGLSEKIEKATRFAFELASGNTSVEYESFSGNDTFSEALNRVKESFVEIKLKEEKRIAEDEIRNWTTSGIAKFNELLHIHNDNIENFAFSILKELISYLSANQGGFFMMEGTEGNEKAIHLIAGYAYDRRKYNKKQIKVGEGLLGMCVLEKKFIYLKEIPDGYMEITSGLGHANPKNLLIMPLIYNDEVSGLIEIASFNEIKKHEIEFLEKVAESIANTLNSVKLNAQTKLLLQQSNERAEELSAQEEEMRQNLEELKATQEEMARIKEEDGRKEQIRKEKEQEFLNQLQSQNEEMKKKQEQLEWEKLLFNTLMDNLHERITIKDKESRYIRINKRKSDALGLKNSDEVIGKTDLDVFGGSHHKKALEEEKEIIHSGSAVYDHEELVVFKNGVVSWASSSRIPIKNEEGEVTGILVITKDINDIKNADVEVSVRDRLIKEISVSQPVLIYKTDKDGKIEKIFGKIIDTNGLQEKDFIGKDFSLIFPEAGEFTRKEINEEGLRFISQLKGISLNHILFPVKTTSGGYLGVAFEAMESFGKTE